MDVCCIAVRFVILYQYWRLCIVRFTWGPSVFFVIVILYFLYSVCVDFLFVCAVAPFFRPLVLQTAGTKHFKPFRLPNSSAVWRKSFPSISQWEAPFTWASLCTDQSLTGRRRGGGVKSADVVHMVAIRISATSLCAPVVRFRTGDRFYWQGNNMFMLYEVLCCLFHAVWPSRWRLSCLLLCVVSERYILFVCVCVFCASFWTKNKKEKNPQVSVFEGRTVGWHKLVNLTSFTITLLLWHCVTYSKNLCLYGGVLNFIKKKKTEYPALFIKHLKRNIKLFDSSLFCNCTKSGLTIEVNSFF